MRNPFTRTPRFAPSPGVPRPDRSDSATKLDRKWNRFADGIQRNDAHAQRRTTRTGRPARSRSFR